MTYGSSLWGEILWGSGAGETYLAYWHGGWFGIEDPTRYKQFRYGTLVTHGPDIDVAHAYVDHEAYTFTAPKIVSIARKSGSHIGTNVKSRLHSYYIQFPAVDVDGEILQLSDSHIPRSER